MVCRITIALFFYIGICFINSYGQGEANNWYFGHRAGINFNSGIAVSLTDGQLSTGEGCATISDKSGQLLFYTDGDTVWNRNHQPMVNGTGLLGHYSSSQSAVIVPRPGSTSIYYIFTVSARGEAGGLNYSVVDINLQGGLGEVTQKNILLFGAPMWEKLNAVRHCNNKDVWVISRLFRSNSYYAYLISANGISSTPVISNAGSIVTDYDGNSIGIMKCSPDGRKIAAVHSALDFTELMDFNNQTGILSNAKKISVRPVRVHPAELGAYGAEFSPDSRYLYISSWYDLFENSYIHQFDASLLSEAAVQSSRVRIDSQRYRQYGAIQLAPDGKIYVTENEHNYLSVINNPDNSGAACDFQARSFFLGDAASRHSYIGLPTFLQSYLATDYKYDFITEFNCQRLSVDFAINYSSGYDSLKWNFDDPASGVLNTSGSATPTHIYPRQGIYFPKLIIYKCTKNDTLVKKIWAGQVNTFLGNDTTLCDGNNLKLDGTAPNSSATYLWNTGVTKPVITASSAGEYWVNVGLADCTYSDTITVNFNPVPLSFNIGKDTTVCESDQLVLKAIPSNTNASHLWNTGSNSPQIVVNKAGSYWLKISNQFQCFKTDTINFSTKPRPAFNLGRDTSLCQGDELKLTPNTSASSYLWSTGDTGPSIRAIQTNLYWCEAGNDGCSYRDTISIIVNQRPKPDLGIDRELCGFAPILLNPNVTGNNDYVWYDNSTDPGISANRSGIYWVDVTNEFGCKKRDSVNLVFKPYPEFSFGPDRDVCLGETVILAASVPGSTYLWNTGSNQNQELITKSGMYWLEIALNGCKYSDTIVLDFKPTPLVNLGTDTTLCEGEILTLNAQNTGSLYAWQDHSENQNYKVSGPGVYFVKVTTDGCSSSDTVKINYDLKPVFSLGADIGICNGQSILLKPEITSSSGNLQYLWQNGSISPEITIDQSGSYQLSISNHCGNKKDTVNVTKGVCNLYMPTAFTPNGDGLNDIFRAGFGENVSSFQMDVFNRWGQKVFSTSHLSKGWDGTYNSVLQPNGAYVWMVAYKTRNDSRENRLKGSVVLIR